MSSDKKLAAIKDLLERREKSYVKEVESYSTKILTGEDNVLLIKRAGQLELISQLLKELR